MKSSEIIYEVSVKEMHNGVGCQWSSFFRTKTGAMRYVSGVIEEKQKHYENEYTVECSFEEKKIKSTETDTIYTATFADITNDIPQHTDVITITKRTLF